MEKSLGLLFYLKKRKNYPDQPVPIYFRITVDRIEREICTKLNVDPSKWSTQSQRLSGRTDAAKAVNDCLDVLYTKAIQARTHLMALSKQVTAENIRALVQDRPIEQYLLLDIFEEHNKKMKQLVGIDYREGTLEKYERTCRHTKSFLQQTRGISNIDIQKLDYSLIVDLEHWLKTVRKCEHNSTMKYLAYLKKIVLYCIKKRWLTHDPFAEFKMTRRKKRRTPL